MPRVVPMVRVLVLEGFISRPGYAARPGELVDVTHATANLVIAQGKARLPTEGDHEAPSEPAPRAPNPPTNPKTRSKSK